jgi:hypothetical protein
MWATLNPRDNRCGRQNRFPDKVLITLRVMELGIVHSRLIPSANETQHHHAERDEYIVAIKHPP